MKPICLPMCLMVLASACGPGAAPLSSFSAAARAPGPEGALVCRARLTLPPDGLPVGQMEADRPINAARPGFQRDWVLAGLEAGVPWGSIVARFESVPFARDFSEWLEDEGFWDRPMFQHGHECRVFEVLEQEEHPAAATKQVAARVERFPAGASRDQLRAWFQGVKVEARARGYTSVSLLYSEEDGMASLVYFQDVPVSGRDITAPPPTARQPPLGPVNDLGWSAWTISIWFPFQPEDEGREAIWPMPGISP